MSLYELMIKEEEDWYARVIEGDRRYRTISKQEMDKNVDVIEMKRLLRREGTEKNGRKPLESAK